MICVWIFSLNHGRGVVWNLNLLFGDITFLGRCRLEFDFVVCDESELVETLALLTRNSL